MRRTILLTLLAGLLACSANAQTVPVKVKKYLDDNYSGWKQAPGACSGAKWLLTGDFNGDGRTDYLVRLLTGSGSNRSLHLIGFINERAEYTPDAFLEEEYTGDIKRTATSVLRAGTEFNSMTEGGPMAILKRDAVNQYICETDASKMYTFQNGQFRSASDTTAIVDTPPILPRPRPTPTPKPVMTPAIRPVNPPAVIVDTPTAGIPDLTGTYTVYDASGNVDKNTGTVTYPNGKMTFKLSDGRAFSTATAYAKDGVITSGWGRNATVSSDGRTIYWTNNTKWVRK